MNPAKNFWPAGIIALFALFFGGMTWVVVIASTHREDLVNSNYYEQELKYQSRIEAAARAQNSGASLRFDAAAGRLVIAVPPAQLAQKLSGTVSLYRAAAPELDREVPLAPAGDGTQTLDAAKLAAGPWQIRAAWTANGENYFLEEKFIVAAK